MILSGQTIIKLQLVQNFIDKDLQQQPCGIDFTLKKIAVWNSHSQLDFDNSMRIPATFKSLRFNNDLIKLMPGSYMVEFNESVTLPLNIMAMIQSRSSLFRGGAFVVAGVIDPGYTGAIGCLLTVVNPNGITLKKNARIAQWVFETLDIDTEKGYNGIYQKADKIV